MIALLLAALLACPASGDAKTATLKALDVLKNRDTAPETLTVVDFGLFLLGGDDTDRFDPQVGIQTTAYVVGVKAGGLETANCHARDLFNRDIHLELGATPDAAPGARVIVEITPRWKATLHHATVASLRLWIGQQVTVSGWPMNDLEHQNMSTNTRPAGLHNWRATSWEVHPITQIEVVP